MTENNYDELEVVCVEEIEFEKEDMIFSANVHMMAKDNSKSHAG